LLNKGWSTKRIELKLRELGISSELIDKNIKNLDENEDEINLVSAINLAKKRSIGPYRKVELTDKIKSREFGILSRAGFSYAITKKVLIDMDKSEIESCKL
jgi:regulatory protein